MRDYDNMPILDWNAAKAPQLAKAQILHREPVILQMPDTFDIVELPRPLQHTTPLALGSLGDVATYERFLAEAGS